MTIKIAIKKIPKIVIQVVGTVSDPNSTSDDLLETMIPPPCKPTKEINIPIPAAIAYFKSLGIALITISRTLRKDKIVNKTEATKTPAIAFCHGIPIANTTE